MEENELINRLKSGDEGAYRLIIEKYQTSVLNCCFKFVKNRETAEDLTQEVFIEVYKSIGSFKSESTFFTWLYRISVTKSLDHLKSMKRKKRYGFLKSIFSGDGEKEILLPSDQNNPLEILEEEDRKKVLSWAIESLPENQKVAFTLSKYDEKSYKEIAEILDTTISSVESLIFRAKTNLKKKLYKYYKENL
jgi:RNA polymerase sigma factor (sigma-70 family)